MDTEYIGGLPVDNLTEDTILHDLPIYISSNKKMIVTSVNPQITMQVERYPEVKAYIERATHRLPDGVGVVKMSKYLGGNIRQRVTGIDVMDLMLRFANNWGYRIFLYGAHRVIVEKAAVNIKKDYPNIIVTGAFHGYTTKHPEEVVEMINKAQPTFLFVALGSPKQELFLQEYVDAINAKVFLDVGGTFDVLSGEVKRAPKFFIDHNLEWLYRSVKYHRPERLKQIPLYIQKSWAMSRGLKREKQKSKLTEKAKKSTKAKKGRTYK